MQFVLLQRQNEFLRSIQLYNFQSSRQERMQSLTTMGHRTEAETRKGGSAVER